VETRESHNVGTQNTGLCFTIPWRLARRMLFRERMTIMAPQCIHLKSCNQVSRFLRGAAG